MERPPRRLLRSVALAALALVASLGLLLSALGLVAATDTGAAAVGRLVVGVLDGALQGRFTIQGLVIRPDGVLELRGFRAATPEGRTALSVARLVVRLDLVAVASRELSARLQLEDPELTLEPGADGQLTIARIFSPPPDPAARPRRPGDPLAGWSFRFTEVALRNGAVTWHDGGGSTLARAHRLELSGTGGFAWAAANGRLRLSGMMETPLAGPLAVNLDARLEDGRLTVRRLGLSARGSRLDAVGWWSVEGDAFRVAVTHLELARADGAGLLPRAAPGASLGGVLYAESDGQRLTAAVDLAGTGARGEGGARAALALRATGPGARALAFDVRLDALDPSRLLARAPPGRISLAARGGAVGPPRGWLGPGGGRLEVERLEASLDGLAATGSFRWRPAGEVEGSLALDLHDLAAARRTIGSLLPWELPDVAGALTGQATLSGTAAVPVLVVHAGAPRLVIAGVELEALRFEGSHDADGDGFTLQATPARFEREPLGLSVRLRRGTAGAPSELTELSVAWPGAHWSLAAPARVTLAPLALDQLVLRDGHQRLTLEGGWRADGRLDARLGASALDLGGLTRRLLPASVDLGGRLDLDLHLTGEEARPSLEADLKVLDGRAMGLAGLRLQGSAGWDGETRRLAADLELARADGGVVRLSGALPLPIGAATGKAPVEARLGGEGLPLELLWPLLGVSPPLRGQGTLQASLRGTVDAPLVAIEAKLSELRWADAPPLDLEVALDLDGAGTRVRAELRRAQATLASASAALGLERSAVLRHPVEALTALAGAPWQATVDLPGAPIDWLAGTGGIPASLGGLLSGHAELVGTPRAPRGPLRLSLKQGRLAGHRDLSLDAQASLEPGRVTLSGELRPEKGGALAWSAMLDAPVERLSDPEVAATAPIRLDLEARDLELAEQLERKRELTGRVSARLAATGTMAAPQAVLSYEGSGLALGQVLIGELRGTGRLDPGRAWLSLDLSPAHGGSLHAEGTLAASIGSRTAIGDLLKAPLSGKAGAEQVDLRVLPAFLPRLFPAAQGKLDADLSVSGTLARPRFGGRARTEGTRLTIAEYGTYTDIGFDASLDPEAITVERFALRRGAGRAEGRLTATRVASGEAKLEGEVLVKELTLGRSGIDYVTVDATALLGGTYWAGRLDLEVTAPDGVRLLLPRKTPRSLQAIERRSDIVIGDPPVIGPSLPSDPSSPGAAGAAGLGPDAEKPFEAHVHVRTDSLVVKSDQPRLLVEVRTDSTWSVVDGALLADGTIDLVHGTVEPMSGRLFKLLRAHVGFNGGPVGEAQLDGAAEYDNPTAKVQVTVVGALANPQLRLTSTPPLDEASIAMLIATGRTEQTVGGSGSASTSSSTSSSKPGTFTAQDAGMAAAMAVANKAFQDRLGDKMPLDTLTLDSTSMSAGKYVTDRILVSYLRRFDARPEQGENTDEVRVQYQMSRRWTLESRYGNAGAGGASILWQADY